MNLSRQEIKFPPNLDKRIFFLGWLVKIQRNRKTETYVGNLAGFVGHTWGRRQRSGRQVSIFALRQTNLVCLGEFKFTLKVTLIPINPLNLIDISKLLLPLFHLIPL